MLETAAVCTSAGRELGHRLISSHPDSRSRQFDEGKVVRGVLLVAGRDGSEVLELVEKALDEVVVAGQEGAEGGLVGPARQRLDVRPSPPAMWRAWRKVRQLLRSNKLEAWLCG